MRTIRITRDFASWRTAARTLAASGVEPCEVLWSDDTADGAHNLFVKPDDPSLPEAMPIHVASEFVNLAKLVSCHRNLTRWPLLYRLLFRLTHGEPKLLQIPIDDDVHAANNLAKAVRRDRHKMTAFVRFRKVAASVSSTKPGQNADASEHYIAWHRPDHYIVKLTAPFFRDRFASLNWAILTPDDSAFWDGKTLAFRPGVPVDPLAGGDDMEQLWTTYYAHIFNPARIKLNAMRAEMPKKHWPTLPETKLIPDLLRDAPRRVEQMLKWTSPMKAVENDVPTTTSIEVLRKAARQCAATELASPGTHTVFGEGPDDAPIVMIGEQPGDEEDRAQKPFIGPAGRLLDEVLEEIALDRSKVYVTNAVKRFKYEQRGPRRIHAKPNARDISAWKPWLLAELDIIKPKIIVLLGATAAQTLMGMQFRVTKQRGTWLETTWTNKTIATIHPSAILRAPDPEMRAASLKAFAEDLRLVVVAMRAA